MERSHQGLPPSPLFAHALMRIQQASVEPSRPALATGILPGNRVDGLSGARD
ncbi:MAG: hypothetical protein H5U25_14335 [Oceanibaculum nanhaiense]|nr:hypothetical protein [Oceanibaculum nanhaiense]